MIKFFSSTWRKFTVLGFLILILVLGFFFFKKTQIPSEKQFKPFEKTVSLDRKWDFKASDKTGNLLETMVTFSLLSAQKTNQIYVKNKPLRTTNDKAFLVLNIELKNETDKRVYFYSSDLVRLLNSENKKFEADFKNQRLEIAPFSTKKDKLAFLIGAQENDFQIQIGEIVGKNETVGVHF